MSSYPVAYRRGARERGFQPPRAANDNQPRRGWSPANDNIPRGQNNAARSVPTRAASSLTRLGGLRTAAMVAGRLVPWVNAALLAYSLYELWQYYRQASDLPVPGGDWTVTTTCLSGSPIGYMTHRSHCAKNTIMFNDASQAWMNNADIGDKMSSFRNWNTSGSRQADLQLYEKVGDNGTASEPAPGLLPLPNPGVLPEPVVEPMDLPIGVPVPVPAPMPFPAIPWARPNPYRDPREQPQVGPGPTPTYRPGRIVLPRVAPAPWYIPTVPVPATTPLPAGQPVPGAVPTPAVIPINVPSLGSVTTTLSPRSSFRRAPETSPIHARKRPPSGVKERKVRINLRGALGVVGLVTESLDWLNALYDALPDEYKVKGKRSNQIERGQAVFDHFDKIDIAKAIQNLLINHIEDKVIGKLSQKAADAAVPHLGQRPVGFQSGPGL